MMIKRTLQGLAATSLLALVTGCAVPQSAGQLQGVAANAIGGVADAISGRSSNSASAAGARAAGQMGGVRGMVNGGSAAMSGAAYGAAGATALGVVDKLSLIHI